MKENLTNKEAALPLSKKNYLIIIAALVLIAIGFVTLAGGGSKDPNVFSYELFSTSRLTVAPLLILAGLASIMVAIMWRFKDSQK